MKLAVALALGFFLALTLGCRARSYNKAATVSEEESSPQAETSRATLVLMAAAN